MHNIFAYKTRKVAHCCCRTLNVQGICTINFRGSDSEITEHAAALCMNHDLHNPYAQCKLGQLSIWKKESCSPKKHTQKTAGESRNCWIEISRCIYNGDNSGGRILSHCIYLLAESFNSEVTHFRNFKNISIPEYLNDTRKSVRTSTFQTETEMTRQISERHLSMESRVKKRK